MLPLFFGFVTVKSLELFTTGKRRWGTERSEGSDREGARNDAPTKVSPAHV
jgi:hypothetical protein